jgi:hypothetical protein
LPVFIEENYCTFPCLLTKQKQLRSGAVILSITSSTLASQSLSLSSLPFQKPYSGLFLLICLAWGQPELSKVPVHTWSLTHPCDVEMILLAFCRVLAMNWTTLLARRNSQSFFLAIEENLLRAVA